MWCDSCKHYCAVNLELSVDTEGIFKLNMATKIKNKHHSQISENSDYKMNL